MTHAAKVASIFGVDRVVRTDALVIGTGVAGLSAALAAHPRRVHLVTKSRLASGSSPYAQGGIAAAVHRDDAPRLHAEDTELAGRGLCESRVVRLVTDAAPQVIRELIALGVVFDRAPDGALALAREGGHGRHRVLHAGGDRTGSALVDALVQAVRRAPHVLLEEDLFVVDLLRDRERVAGAFAIRESRGGLERLAILARDVVLATGGLGQVYRFTTNPAEVTGDGIAMAARAGARLVDLEFVQFHPTALRRRGDSREAALPLLTEALRGAGALLIDETGQRFLPEGELAPRDIVSLGIFRHARAGHEVFLDLRPVEALEERFPTVVASCRDAGHDPSTEPVPVTPAAHYAMGGVAIDANGRTSLPGLWACGETASSGAHGANRLASNSLLEAIVFGRRLAGALDAPTTIHVAEAVAEAQASRRGAALPRRGLDVAAAREELRDLMWRHVGLERAEGGLGSALTRLSGWQAERDSIEITSRALGELRNSTLAAALVTLAAHERRESRGAHFRSDYPTSRAELGHRNALRVVAGHAPLRERVLFERLSVEPEDTVLAGGVP